MNNKELGRIGEYTAQRFLEKEGYRITATNYAVPFGEIDIVCQKNEEIIFVEVKTRLSKIWGNGAEAVTKNKQANIRRVAQWYLSVEKPSYMNVRFDVIEIELNHLPNSF